MLSYYCFILAKLSSPPLLAKSLAIILAPNPPPPEPFTSCGCSVFLGVTSNIFSLAFIALSLAFVGTQFL
tara:strand:+ start:525 stop:734 length:210 start_codon:yes stop_codon:yes gene_type:complete